MPISHLMTDKKAGDQMSVPTEEIEQRIVAKWLNIRRVKWFHPPNEGRRAVHYHRKLKQLGMKPGIPDIIIIDRPPNYPESPGVVIELKRRDGGTTSEAQKRWIDDFRNRGWHAHVCNGADAAIRLLESLGFGGAHTNGEKP